MLSSHLILCRPRLILIPIPHQKTYVASPTRWTWIWASSRSWWWTGKPGVLSSMGLQRVGPDWAIELNWLDQLCCYNPRLLPYTLWSFFIKPLLNYLNLRLPSFPSWNPDILPKIMKEYESFSVWGESLVSKSNRGKTGRDRERERVH